MTKIKTLYANSQPGGAGSCLPRWLAASAALTLLAWLVACTPLPVPQADTPLGKPPLPATDPTITPAAPLETPATQPALIPLVEREVITSTPPPTPTLTPPPARTLTPTPGLSVRFAVIGDYGSGSQAAHEVAAMVAGWNPDLIITTGDNNYPIGERATIDHHIGRDYSRFIYPYTGIYGEDADQNRFFPSLGNHDWMSEGADPYLDYFSLPGNERYYDFTWGPVHFFALNSDWNEPDGISSDSQQAMWLKERLAASTLPWKIVYMHVPPYSSGLHGPGKWMRWPFAEWGANAVLAGHDHTYERLHIDGIPYFINGLGGGAIYYFREIDPHSQFRYNDDYGAMLVTADEIQITFQFFNRLGELIDTFSR